MKVRGDLREKVMRLEGSWVGMVEEWIGMDPVGRER